LAAVFEVFFGCDVVCKYFRTLTIFSNFLWWSSNIRRVSGVSVKIRVRPYCLFFCFWLRRTCGVVWLTAGNGLISAGKSLGLTSC
jgi:hypothetical protein